MTTVTSDWSIRTLLNPVAARLIIYGVHPVELERVLARIEATPLTGPRDLETRWMDEWTALARRWEARSAEALAAGHRRTAGVMAANAAGCRLAMYLINTTQLDRKREVYLEYARTYRGAAACFDPPAHPVRIPYDDRRALSAILHLPATVGPRPVPCVAIFAGLGSCKEEMNVLARAMVQRGVAALVPDLPGTGESLFADGLAADGAAVTRAFAAVAEFVATRPELDAGRLGTCGLCMGGGWAYRAAAHDRRYGFCATLFPLFIDQVPARMTPLWMRSGAWFKLQTGGTHPAEILKQFGLHDDDAVACPYFLVHGRHDNWMSLDRAMVLYDRAPASSRKLLVIEDEPHFASGEEVTHAMPVGEQLYWVAPIVGDWIADLTGASSAEPR